MEIGRRAGVLAGAFHGVGMRWIWIDRFEEFVPGKRAVAVPGSARRRFTSSNAIAKVPLVCRPYRCNIVVLTAAGLAESHPHDVQMTADAPNYRGRLT